MRKKWTDEEIVAEFLKQRMETQVLAQAYNKLVATLDKQADNTDRLITHIKLQGEEIERLKAELRAMKGH
jgi:septal ring factor EnvC (AmiA/AmiB activator)